MLSLLTALLCPFGACVAGESVTSEPVGAFVSAAAANSDTLISPTLTRPSAARCTVSAVSGATLTASGSPGWTSNAFAGAAYHVRFLTGALRGQFCVVTANSNNTLTVDAAGLSLASVAAGDAFEVTPFWTLGSFLPATMAGTTFTTTTSPFLPQTQLLFFDANATGINRAASAVYFFYNGAWRKSGAAISQSFDSTVIYPDSYFIQRNKASATTLTYTGRVQPGALGTILEAVSHTANDNFVAVAYPLDITLSASGLAAGGFTATTSPFAVKDQLLWFNPAGTGTNRAASAVYFYYNGAWRKSGSSIASDFGTSVTLKAGSGFIVRKASGGLSGTTSFLTGI